MDIYFVVKYTVGVQGFESIPQKRKSFFFVLKHPLQSEPLGFEQQRMFLHFP